MSKLIKDVEGYFNAEDISYITYERVIDEMRNGTYEIRVYLKNKSVYRVMGWRDGIEEVKEEIEKIVKEMLKD